jgi:hypothetical protein
MATRLKHLTVTSVDSVDKGANPEARIVFLKRQADADVALGESIASIFADPDVVDKLALINQQIADYQEYVGKSQERGATNMDAGHENAMVLAKAALATGVSVLSRASLTEAIEKRAEAIRRPGETTQQVFVRAITTDPDARALYKASKQAPGPDHAPQPLQPQDGRPMPPPFHAAGPASAALQAMADDHLRANPTSTPERSFAAVYNPKRPTPEQLSLRSRAKAEQLAALQRTTNPAVL